MCHCNPRMHQSRLATPVDVPYWKFVVWVEVKYKITVGVSIAIHEVEILAIGPVTLRVDVIGQADRKEAQIQVRSKVSGVDRGSVPSVLVVENPEGLGRVVLMFSMTASAWAPFAFMCLTLTCALVVNRSLMLTSTDVFLET